MAKVALTYRSSWSAARSCNIAPAKSFQIMQNRTCSSKRLPLLVPRAKSSSSNIGRPPSNDIVCSLTRNWWLQPSQTHLKSSTCSARAMSHMCLVRIPTPETGTEHHNHHNLVVIVIGCYSLPSVVLFYWPKNGVAHGSPELTAIPRVTIPKWKQSQASGDFQMTLETGRRCGTENRRNPRRANQSQENLRYCT